MNPGAYFAVLFFSEIFMRACTDGILFFFVSTVKRRLASFFILGSLFTGWHK